MVRITENETTLEESALNKTIGMRIRVTRMNRKITQEQLAAYLDFTFQQLQKIERGENRCSAGRLFQIARFLHCDPKELFPHYSETANQTLPLRQLSHLELILINDLANMSQHKRALIYKIAREFSERKDDKTQTGADSLFSPEPAE